MPFSQGPKVIGLGNFFIRQANAIVLIVKNGIIKFFNEFMSLLMVVNRKELIFSPSTTSSYCRGRKSIKDPFLFQALAFICLGPLPSIASLQYVIRTRPKKRVLTIWYSREETTQRRNKEYLCYQNQMQIDPYEKGIMYQKLYSNIIAYPAKKVHFSCKHYNKQTF